MRSRLSAGRLRLCNAERSPLLGVRRPSVPTRWCANGDQLGFSSAGPGESGPRSSISAAGSSYVSTIWVSAATAVCGLTCLTFDWAAFLAPARLGLALAASFRTGLAVFFAAARLRAFPIADDFRLRAVVRFFRRAMVTPVLCIREVVTGVSRFLGGLRSNGRRW